MKDRPITGLAAILLMAAFAHPALADSTVRAFLWNDPNVADTATDQGIGMTGDPKTAQFGVAVSLSTVPAGTVTFDVMNSTKDVVHEMVISPLGPDGALALDADGGGVNEDKSRVLGQVNEIAPGDHGSVTLDLPPGRYVLYCNLPGHYMSGMWSILTVS